MRLLLITYAFGASSVVADAAQRYGSFPLVPDGLMPRYFIDKSVPLLKRDGTCEADNHPCLDIGFSNECCDNDSYCYVNNDGDPKCCPIGSNCTSDTRCKSEDYFCTQTSTTHGTAVPFAACCNRSCPKTSQYQCPDDLGGNCCSFGSECKAGGNCVSTQQPSKTALLTPVDEGCTTSQSKCADGTGCCDNTLRCTQVSGDAFCARGTPTGTDVTFTDEDDMRGDGLSDGAKAGIAVGVVVGAGIIIGLITWLCLSKRRRRRQTMTQQSGSGEQADDANMTEVTASSRPREAGYGLTQDYFGPDAVPGPYTETVDSSPGPRMAVPSQPEQPGDIAAPVEIGSKEGPLTPGSPVAMSVTPASETIDGRFELHGTEMSPAALSPSALSPSRIPSTASPRSDGTRPELS